MVRDLAGPGSLGLGPKAHLHGRCWICEIQGWRVWQGLDHLAQVLEPTCMVGAGSVSSRVRESSGAWVDWPGFLGQPAWWALGV